MQVLQPVHQRDTKEGHVWSLKDIKGENRIYDFLEYLIPGITKVSGWELRSGICMRVYSTFMPRSKLNLKSAQGYQCTFTKMKLP